MVKEAPRARAGRPVDLSRLSTLPPETARRAELEERFSAHVKEIGRLQELLYSAGTQRVLVVLQGMDTSGKDGTIRKVFGETDPLGCEAIPFKAPSEDELAHDFLWRVHRRVPASGHITIFNRSHYEDVLIARVRSLVPESTWRKRYEHINAFERLLVDEGTIVLKFFLHISKEEQKERLLAREAAVEKSWKLTVQDWKERRHWNEYMAAYQDAIAHCDTEHAPWHLIPADKKWYRNYAVATVVREALAAHEGAWREHLAALSKERMAELEAYKERD